MSGRFLRSDNMLIVCLSFLFTPELVHIRMKEVLSASSVHLLLFIVKNGRTITEVETRIQ